MEQRIISIVFGLLITMQRGAGDDMGLLSSTLRAFRQTSCENDLMTLSCPIGTSISVEVVQYGKKEENSSLQCAYTDPMDSRYPVESTTLIADMPFVLGNLTFSLVDTSLNETSLLEKSRSKCIHSYVLQYSILQIVVEACQKKRKCSFRASPKVFDSIPCPGIHKLVEVSHKCRPFEFRSLIACEKDVIRLACGRYTRVAIYSASYGRTAYESSHCTQTAGSKEETCLSAHTSHTLTEICQGRRKCTVAVEASTFGSPCPENVRVSLKVVYACVSRNVFRDRYISPLEEDELDPQFEMNELYDDEFTPAPNQVDDSSSGQISHKFSDELEATVKAENILTHSKDANIEHRIDNHLLVIVVVVIFFGCCLSIGALVAYKMRLLSSTDNACIKHSESSDPQSNTTSNAPNEDFDLVECVAETIPVAVKMKQTTYEHPSTSAPFMPTFKVFNHPDAVPQISTTMFILPNYIVTEGNLQSNKNVTLSQQTSAAVENLSLTVADATVSSMDQYSHESSSCLQCNFLGWPTATTGPPPASIEQKASTLRQNQSFKIPDNERKICQNDSFLWLGLRVGVM
ncbi:protein eva-1 homolog C-like [Aedes albopictus]|uniref:SUEL-type lectin domain-containing protein n=1 Tax=Aedes albopictus TaxID=7160 RepID=A0ABM1Z349_AEDAL|nr:protein eva-1 homolog C-like [Aedes albopictus]